MSDKDEAREDTIDDVEGHHNMHGATDGDGLRMDAATEQPDDVHAHINTHG